MVHLKPFFDPILETPKDITTKTGEDTSGMLLYHHWLNICSQKKKKKQITANLISSIGYTSVVQRTI